VDIRPIPEGRKRQVTFMKRKSGLLKKAMELSILCQCDMAVVIFNHNGKLYDYGSSDIHKTIRRFRRGKNGGGDAPPSPPSTSSQSRAAYGAAGTPRAVVQVVCLDLTGVPQRGVTTLPITLATPPRTLHGAMSTRKTQSHPIWIHPTPSTPWTTVRAPADRQASWPTPQLDSLKWVHLCAQKRWAA
jgi:hypothetical protein